MSVYVGNELVKYNGNTFQILCFNSLSKIMFVNLLRNNIFPVCSKTSLFTTVIAYRITYKYVFFVSIDTNESARASNSKDDIIIM